MMPFAPLFFDAFLARASFVAYSNRNTSRISAQGRSRLITLEINAIDAYSSELEELSGVPIARAAFAMVYA